MYSYCFNFVTVRAIIITSFFLFTAENLLGQADMVPFFNLNSAVSVYDFLKTMRVKKIIAQYNDDNINLSRGELSKLLDEIESKRDLLSSTEKILLERYKLTYREELIEDKELSTVLIDGAENFGYRLGDMFFSDKEKFFYFRRLSDKSTLFIDMMGNGTNPYQFSPNSGRTSMIWDGGFRARGTLKGNLGYALAFYKGFLRGDRELMLLARPILKANFKFVENIDAFASYDFTEGYIRYETDPEEDFHLSVQFGREDIRYGLGYGSRLVWSGESPAPDMLKFNLSYGALHYSQVHLSVPGDFSFNRLDNFTKYFAIHRVKLAFTELFDIGIGDIVVYSDRGIDFAYLNPFLFYKFAEQSLQDRDNGLMFFDIQTHFFKNLEFQATFLMDETPDFGNINRFSNKWAYQIGAFLYEPFGLENFSAVFEYTYIRPYVYTHWNPKNVYSSWGIGSGHRLQPNSDELYARLNYNLSDRIRFQFEAARSRHGRNRLAPDGSILENVGGDIRVPYRPVDPENAPFLAGVLHRGVLLGGEITFEPWKNYLLNFRYQFRSDRNTETNALEESSIFVFRFGFEY
ncbi:MAG: hypothetical protein SFU91_05675 [Chloroherpetonaceae bacterium]|nr:hypothetical protein [Chloroherpetonaceae bacterium]